MWLILHLGRLSSSSLFVCFTGARILLAIFDPHWAMDHHLGGQLFRAEVGTYRCKGIGMDLCKEHIWDKEHTFWREPETCSPWGGQLTYCGWPFAPLHLVFLNTFPLWVLQWILFLIMNTKEGGSETFCTPSPLLEARARHMTVMGKDISLDYPVLVTRSPLA